MPFAKKLNGKLGDWKIRCTAAMKLSGKSLVMKLRIIPEKPREQLSKQIVTELAEAGRLNQDTVAFGSSGFASYRF